MNTRSIQRALNGGVSHSLNGAEFSRGMCHCCMMPSLLSIFCVNSGTIIANDSVRE